MVHIDNSKYIYLIIISFYTIIQFICLYIFGYTPYPDSNGYILLAQECVNNNTFYPKNLYDIYFLWNIGTINAVVLSLYLFNSIIPLLILYTLMQSLIAWCTYNITQLLFNKKTAIIALMLFVLYPANYGYNTSVLSETPFICFSLFALHQALKQKLFISGIYFAIANYFRPMAILFIVALFLFMIFRRYKLRKYFNLIIGFCIITLSIGSINYIYKGVYFSKGAMGWMGLMQYSWDHDSNKQNDYHFFEFNDPNKISKTENYHCLQRDSVWRSHFFIWLSNNKLEYLKQIPKKVIKTYISDNVNFCSFLPNKETRQYMYNEISMYSLIKDFPNWTSVQLLTGINLIYYYLLLLFAILGALYSIRNKRLHKSIIPIATIFAGTALIIFVGHGEARFHQPLMPMFIILSSYYIYIKNKKPIFVKK